MYDLPGRYNNLYKSRMHGVQSGIDERVSIKESGAHAMLCNNALTAQNFGTNACFSRNYQREDLIPARRIQYDLLVEKALYPQIVNKKSKPSVPTPVIIISIALFILYFAKR